MRPLSYSLAVAAPRMSGSVVIIKPSSMSSMPKLIHCNTHCTNRILCVTELNVTRPFCCDNPAGSGCLSLPLSVCLPLSKRRGNAAAAARRSLERVCALNRSDTRMCGRAAAPYLTSPHLTLPHPPHFSLTTANRGFTFIPNSFQCIKHYFNMGGIMLD